MSLISIAQEIADSVGLPAIQQVIGNNDNNVRQILAIIKRSGRTLSQMTNSEGDGWSTLNKTHEFQTVNGQAEYDLPNDFKHLIVKTAWQKDKYWQLRGSLNSRQWARLVNRRSTVGYNVFRIARTTAAIGAASVGALNLVRKFVLEPPPGGGEDIVFDYVSKFWWVSNDGTTFKAEPTADTDESLFGDHIHIMDGIWRYKAANNFGYAVDLADFEVYRDQALAQDMAAEPIPVGHGGEVTANRDESDVEW